MNVIATSASGPRRLLPRWSVALAACFLWACEGVVNAEPSTVPSGDSDDPTSGDGPGDADGEADGDADGGPLPTDPGTPSEYPKACPELYDQSLLPTFEVEIAPAEWQAMVEEFTTADARAEEGLELKPYHPIVFRYGGEVVRDAMMRLKGNPCCSWRGPKMQFVIAFNQINEQGRFHGLRKIALDAPPYDATLLRERLALAYMRARGVPAPCANNARLVINGRYYGLFVNLEVIDKEFLERNFALHEGNLYKYGHDLRTNEQTADTRPMSAFWAARDIATLDRLADLDEIILASSVEAMIPNGDGFWAGGVNFYLYEHPERGFVLIPYDLDFTFSLVPSDADPVSYAAPWGTKPSPLLLLLGDGGWRAAFVTDLRAQAAAYQPAVLEDWLERWDAQIAGAVTEDPNAVATALERAGILAELRDYFELRAAFVRRWLGAVAAPLEGHDGP